MPWLAPPPETPVPEHVIECPDCGLFQHGAGQGPNVILRCVRCAAVLRRGASGGATLGIVCTGIAALLLALALREPLFEMRLAGRFATAGLITGPRVLSERGLSEVALVVALSLFVLPALHLTTLVLGFVSARRTLPARVLLRVLDMRHFLRRWSMIEVFLLGAFVAYVRLRAWTNVSIGDAVPALIGVMCATIAAEASFDYDSLWDRLPVRTRARSPAARWIGCPRCQLVNHACEGEDCARCRRRLQARKPRSLVHTTALCLGAVLLSFPANVLPVLDVTQFGRRNIDTILSGVVELTEHHLWGLAIVIFVASIIIPVVKLLGLAVMVWMTHQKSAAYLRGRARLFRFVHGIGRWSMVDVYAVTVLVSLVHMGILAAILPGLGAAAFCAVVVVTMLATESFDPRLMWDAAGLNSPSVREGAR